MKQQSPDRLTLGSSPCTWYWAPDNRKITSKKVREALSWAYPYKNVILATGLIPNVNAIPATNLMPPGLPGRAPYNVTGRKGFQSDPAKARALLNSVNAMGYEIRFLFQTDAPGDVKSKDAIVKGLTEAGFKASPCRRRRRATAARLTTPARTSTSAQPAGARTGRPARPGCPRCWDPRTRTRRTRSGRTTPPSATRRSTTRWPYFPLFTTYYSGIAQAHGSRIQGDNDDTTLGMPTWKNIWISQ